ncbi:MAG: type IV pilin protein [Gammaproteobacteria bacterium]|nr:type IV pilin protein [Gammaproteobacteria bacterium]
MKTKQQGLTLVELMVVVAVLSIIASVAYPLYTTQMQKIRRADAKTALAAVALAQERYYTANGGYAATLSSLQLSTELSGGRSEKGYYNITRLTVTNSGQSYTVQARKRSAAAQADDTTCSWFQIDHTGDRTARNSSCW